MLGSTHRAGAYYDKLGVGSLRAGAGKIRIEGHTDNIPIIFSERFISNWDLSAARSSSVAAALIEDSGLKASRLMVAGFADTQPLASNDTEQGRKRNRRGLISLLKGSPV